MKRILAIALFAAAAVCMAQQAQVRVDIDGTAEKVPLTTVKSEQGLSVDNPGWMKENKDYYMCVSGGPNIGSTWTNYELSFIPEKDGKVRLVLMGPWFKAKDAQDITPIWVAYDNLIVTGAEVKNPNFENINDQGMFEGWEGNPASVVKGQDDAQSGKNYIKVWHNQSAAQNIDVKKGQKVTIKFNIKAVEDKK